MANKEMQRLRELTEQELLNELEESKRELFSLKCQWMASKQLSNSARLGALRNKIARIQTVQTQRVLKQQEVQANA